MNLKPLANRVIIKPLDQEKTTASGIVLPETKEERPSQGEIMATGPGKRNDKGELIPMTVQVGNKILFKKYGPDEFELHNEKFLIADEEDILAIIE